MKRTFSLAQLGSAGLLSKVPVFHRVCSTYSHTQTARCNIRMEVKECSVYLVDIYLYVLSSFYILEHIINSASGEKFCVKSDGLYLPMLF